MTKSCLSCLVLKSFLSSPLQMIIGDIGDCAITKDPRTGEWFLLQTIPGFRFRSLRNQQNHTTSLQYFRNIVDNIRFGRPQQPSEVLGRYFQPNYKNLLNLIPFQEITYIDPSPIGRGDKGVVHRAVWSCPRKIGMWSAETIDVALKSLKVPGTQDLEHFMRELDASFAAFQSKAIGCIELLGILMTPPREAHSISNRPISVLQTETLFLVLEFATEGSIIGYLNRTLTGQQSDWPVIIRFISNLANGLERVHDQGIIHRDIHPGNVLVTSRKDRGMPNRELPREPIALISDLGEGQLINNQSLGRACYGDPRYWAPEIRNSNTYSKASDVYAMGRLVADIVAVNWQIASNNGVVSKLIPQVLLEMIVNCQNPFPERRPSISEICQTLEDVRMSEKHNDLVLIPIDPEVLQSFISQSGNEPSGSSSSEIPT
ncbi:kinase-like protein [Hyaloscypha variabilis]|uniref:Kinase-like protein n=1 Tax=Hyaloscypha variabilis (strain UAMH 11265 / GT02V1 / F) TaxID=1149755 RepID=A0A2J6RHE0_HYAVF|nr:kinase-like protein [Hyaloscypha variabilis F]